MQGAKPKDPDRKVTRTPVVHDWIEVPDQPYTGDRPNPGVRSARSKAWWEAVSTMPHCVLWTRTQWQLAIDTAHAHADWVKKGGPRPGELRLLENKLGTTPDARRDLRIRYVPVKAPAQADGEAAIVTDIGLARDRRRRLEDDE